MSQYTEDTLVQQTTADFLENELGWDSVYAYNRETFGPEGTLGRENEQEIILTRYLEKALRDLNPNLPDSAYQEAIRQIKEYSTAHSLLQINREKYNLLKNGVKVTYRNDKDERVQHRLQVFNFKEPVENDFLVVRELWVKGPLYRRRCDVVGFVNGIPLLFMELKTLHRNIRAAYEENLSDYKDTISHLFHHNAFIVLGNGDDARIGTFSSKFEYFHQWKRLAEDEAGRVNMETLLRGICKKEDFLNLFENFILFDDSSGGTAKILAKNHQYLGVSRAIEAVEERKKRDGKLGVFWHTQGAGKSYSMVFFTRKIHRKMGGNFTFLICTDREDLDSQIYNTYAGCNLVNNDKEPCRPESGDDLERMINEQHKKYIFTLIQKFNKDVDPDDPYSDRDDIIVITDEAHRTQYGRLALNMRNAIPNASYIGFTGTPLVKNDDITRRVFGDYVSMYDFQRAVDDNATLPLYYDARGEKLGITTEDLNEKIAAKLEELETEIESRGVDVTERLESELRRDYHIITAHKRLDQIARDFVDHYSASWQSGKAMFVCIDKLTCVRMYNLIEKYWNEKIKELDKEVALCSDDQEEIQLKNKHNWMEETIQAVIVSEEQGEVNKFRQWGYDIKKHRRLIKNGFEIEGEERIDVDTAFKRKEHPFRISIVCAMWLTGFDVPSLSNLYLDKPLRAHTLMQAIARANRVDEGKNNGLIIDYNGILKNLRRALATFAGHKGEGIVDGDESNPVIDPARPEEELLEDLDESVSLIRSYLNKQGFEVNDIINQTGFDRNKAVVDAKEAINESDKTRKRFEIMAREVFKKFKACLTVEGINNYRHDYDAINLIYKSLRSDREKADISDIIRELHQIVDDAIITDPAQSREDETTTYDISQIDFDRLRREFERADTPKRTTVQSLKAVVEDRLQLMLEQNPMRMNLHRHYEDIIEEYNREKERVTIEKTFEALLKFYEDLSDESKRAMREGLDEETLALFDILAKPELEKDEIKKIKSVAEGLLQRLKKKKLNVDHWREKEATRDAVKVAIHNYLYDEEKGLPKSYSSDEITIMTDEVYLHMFRNYSTPEPEIYI